MTLKASRELKSMKHDNRRSSSYKLKALMTAHLNSFGLGRSVATNEFKASKKNLQEVVIHGETYKVGDLIISTAHRRQSNFMPGIKGFAMTLQKPSEEVAIFKKEHSINTDEARKNDLIRNFMEDDKNKIEEVSIDAEEFEEQDDLSNDSSSSFKGKGPLDDDDSPDAKNDHSSMNVATERRKSTPGIHSNTPESKSDDDSILDDIDTPIFNEFVKMKSEIVSKTISDPTANRSKNIENIVRKASFKMMKPIQSQQSAISTLFHTNSKFRNAVKLKDAQSFEKVPVLKTRLKIVTLDMIKKSELELMSKYTTGYSYAVDIDEDKMYTMLDMKHSSK